MEIERSTSELSFSKYSILIVDDNQNNLITLRTVIKEHIDAKILEADSGENALKILLREEVDLIILDIQMKGIDGFETARMIKNRKKTEDIPIIFLTAAYVNEQFQKYGFEIGAVDYLIKPIDEYLLINRINVYLKLIEKERNINQILEKEVEIKTKELIDANKAKDVFLANMSHELRTPLHGIIGSVQILETMGLNHSQREFFNIINISSKRMVNLVDDLLQASVIEYGKPKLECSEISIYQIVKSIVEHFNIEKENMKEKNNVSLTFHICEGVPKCLIGDGNKISQILLNLVGNALKFTNNGFVKIEVSKYCMDDEDENKCKLEIRITDSGIGIKEADFERLFHSFSQLDGGYSKKYQGAGLGLAISKKLANLMNGDICVTSEIAKGSEFVVSMELERLSEKINLDGEEKMEEEIEEKIEENIACGKDSLINNSKKNILIVDDDKIGRELMVLFCRKFGFEALVAADGVEALRMIEENNVDVIFMDIQMPRVNGIEVTEKIREIEKSTGKHIKIIALTAFALKGDREKFLECGMDDYLSKPVDMETVRETVAKYC